MYNQQKWVKSVDSQTKRKLYIHSTGVFVRRYVSGRRWALGGVALTGNSYKVLFFAGKLLKYLHTILAIELT